MNPIRFSPDDPRLTAYALGQLQGDEHATVEAALRDDPEARALVEQTRAFSARLESALAHEPEIEPAPVPSVPAGSTASRSNDATLPQYEKSAKILRFPQLYFVVGGLAAAGVALLVALHQESPPVKVYQEITLGVPAKAETPAAATGVVEVRKTEQESFVGGTLKENLVARTKADAAAEVARTKAQVAEKVARTRPSVFGSNDEKGGLLKQVNPAGPVTLNAGGVTFSASQPGDIVLSATQPEADVIAGALSTTGRIAAVAGTTDRAERASVIVATTGTGLTLGQGRAPASGDARFWAHPATVGGAFNVETYAYKPDTGFVTPQQQPFSTFSVDVDTASYANVRRFIEGGRLPPIDAVRVEELLNYFPYHYPAPAATKGAPPFAIALEATEAPWAPTHRLVRIGLKARELTTAARPPANLVFLLDVSGSMSSANKLPLVKQSMERLVQALRPDDRVAIVTYAGFSGLALPSTPVARVRDIEAALDALHAGGGTNGAMGIQLAYDVAKANFVAGGINRVILCTDGDFNLGTTSQGELGRLVEEKASSGVALTALGFGMGNLKDSTLKLLADKGHGNYGYIDHAAEAEKLLAQQVNGTLMTVARDVKLQVDFNPAQVAAYRLIGYEGRRLQTEDFRNDAVDAGDVGAGHTVTALYEIVPMGVADAALAPAVDRSRYAPEASPGASRSASAEMLTVKVRYKEPDATTSEQVEFPFTDAKAGFDHASSDMKFAAAVAGFGMILRDSPNRGSVTIGDVVAWASSASAKPQDDPAGYRSQFIDLARRAQALLR